MAKVRKHFMLPNILVKKIVKLSEERGIAQSEIVAEAIRYYVRHEGIDYPKLSQTFRLMFSENFDEIYDELRRIRFAINQLAKESQLNIEFWNDYYNYYGNGEIVTTDIKKANELKKAEKNVMNKLLKAQQKKHS
mgnify:CR=1 FL=1